jgi:hypothetical protein
MRQFAVNDDLSLVLSFGGQSLGVLCAIVSSMTCLTGGEPSHREHGRFAVTRTRRCGSPFALGRDCRAERSERLEPAQRHGTAQKEPGPISHQTRPRPSIFSYFKKLVPLLGGGCRR